MEQHLATDSNSSGQDEEVFFTDAGAEFRAPSGGSASKRRW